MPRDVIARARDEFDAVVAPGPADMTVDEVIVAATAHRADAIQFVNTLPLTAPAISRLPASVRVGATSSVGYDHIDVAAAKARGLVVTNTPGVLSDCTADFAFMMLLAAARRAYEYDSIMRRGLPYRIGQGDMRARRAGRIGKTLGLLGMGGVGGAMARRARGFDMRVFVSRPQPSAARAGEWCGVFRRLPCHAAALRLPVAARPRDATATDRDLHQLAQTLALLPRGAVLVNVARGGLVDEDALYDALTSGQLPSLLAWTSSAPSLDFATTLRCLAQRDPVAAYRLRLGGDAQRHGIPRA